VDGKVELFKKIHTAFTYLSKDTHRFKVVNAPTRDNLEEYCHLALKTAEEQKEYFMGS
jgi:chloramphenicol O-acetyltransferase type B